MTASGELSDRTDGLLALALARPQAALTRGRALVASSSDPELLSYARQAIGIVLRDSGETAPAVAELRAALRDAARSGSDIRVADVRATLGAALVMDGRTRTGLDHLDAAAAAAARAHSADRADRTLLATVLLRRAFVLSQLLGRHTDALADLRRALPVIRRAGDPVWEARALNNRAAVFLSLGQLHEADRDLVAAEVLWRTAGQELEAVHVVQNRGYHAYLRGDLPAAMRLNDAARERYSALGADSSDLAMGMCQCYLAAGLAAEARHVVEDALVGPRQPAQRAELQLRLAQAALAQGDAAAALASAGDARRLFRGQRRPWWALQAELAQTRATYELAPDAPHLPRTAASLARRLESVGSEEAPDAFVLAGRLARGEHGRSMLATAAEHRRSGSPLVRARGWLARALERQRAGDRRGLLVACARGLDALDDHQAMLGSTELRALATAHGEELTDLALANAATSGSARSLLRWSERWRATALALPPVRPPEDAVLAGEMARLRETAGRLERAREQPAAVVGLEREQAALEHAVRRRRLQVAGAGGRPRRPGVEEMLDGLGDTTLVELVDVGGTLYAVVAADRRVRRRKVGPTAAAVRAVEFAGFTLRQAARGRTVDLGSAGRRLETSLLGPAARELPDGPVLVSPPSRLHASPWSLMPSLQDRAVTVSPSAALWLRSAEARTSGAPVVLVGGPGLPAEGAELLALSAELPHAVVLRDGSATVARCLEAMDGAGLVHLVAHGRFRRDNPMFSALVLDDGPLTVHDLEGLRRPPRRLVLSACDSGVMAPVGADELLGLAAALLGMGSAGLVSSVAEVNDAATPAVMLDVHRALLAGAGLAEALLAARRAAHHDPLREATAAAFVAIGR